jgi:hypothetical protein
MRTARVTAEHLAVEFDRPGIVDDVEAELYARSRGQRPDDYLDPIALGSLVVSVANLAWVVYMDRKKAKKATIPAELADAVKAEMPESENINPEKRDHIITIVVTETIRAEDD